MEEARIDRTVIKQMTHEEAELEDLAYWFSKTPQERLAGLEDLRRWAYGTDATHGRLQRVLEFARLGEH